MDFGDFEEIDFSVFETLSKHDCVTFVYNNDISDPIAFNVIEEIDNNKKLYFVGFPEANLLGMDAILAIAASSENPLMSVEFAAAHFRLPDFMPKAGSTLFGPFTAEEMTHFSYMLQQKVVTRDSICLENELSENLSGMLARRNMLQSQAAQKKGMAPGGP